MEEAQLSPQDRICFVIAPIGDDGSEIRSWSDKVLRHIIEPAAKACNYQKVIRADKISRLGLITSQIIQHLIDDSLIIADLTSHNPNVFYELAVCHVLRKPVVQLIRIGQSLPFDIAQSRTIIFDLYDPDSLVSCKDQLIEQIQAVEQNPLAVDNPISVSLDLKELRKSENPLAKSNAEMMGMLQPLQAAMVRLERQISSTRTPIAVTLPGGQSISGVVTGIATGMAQGHPDAQSVSGRYELLNTTGRVTVVGPVNNEDSA